MSDQDRYEYEVEQEAWWKEQDQDQIWIDEQTAINKARFELDFENILGGKDGSKKTV